MILTIVGVGMKEKQIQNQIMSYLQHVPNSIWWEVNTTGIYDQKKKTFRQRRSKFNYRGIADCIGFYKGRFVAFEIKTPKRRKQTTVEQDLFLDSANYHNQVGAVVCSVEDVVKVLKDINENTPN